jgi:RNA polymerase sigma-70 factor (ECF subfamily)
MDVEQVVRAAQRGDPEAMDALVRALLPYVGRICGAIAMDKGDDAVQETMIAVLRNLGALRQPEAVRGWVRRIAVREAMRQATAEPILSDQATLDFTPARLIDLDGAIDVRATLARLPPAQRAILVLRDMDGLAEAEVAALLNMPEGTAKSRLHRARKAFAGRWNE